MKNNNLTALLNFPKLKQIKYRNNNITNIYSPRNQTFDKSNKTSNLKDLSRNNFNKNKFFINSSSFSNLFQFKSTELTNKKINYNNFINSYKFKKNQNIKNSSNIRKILFNNNKIIKLDSKENSKLKVNQAVNTSNLLLYDNKAKFNFRSLSKSTKNKNFVNLININDINEICFSVRKKLKKKNYSKAIKDYFKERIIKDKYAYIYLSDKAESIKYSRRINYNPLDV